MAVQLALSRSSSSRTLTLHPPSLEHGAIRDWHGLEHEYDISSYPATSGSIYPSVTSPTQCQKYLRLRNNFSSSTDCDMFEVRAKSGGTWTHFDDTSFRKYLDNPNNTCDTPSLRVFFVYLREHENTSFGYQLSIEQEVASRFLDDFDINPHFVQFLLGKNDYLAPFSAHAANIGGDPQLQLMCQFPKWHDIGPENELSCSVYFSHDHKTKNTTYIITSEKGESFNNKAAKALTTSFCLSPITLTGTIGTNPFLVNSILARECLLEAETVIDGLRQKLQDQLVVIDAYAQKGCDRDKLQQATRQLHNISQECEWHLASAEMLSMITRGMTHAHRRTASTSPGTYNAHIEDSLSYLGEAIELQKRWIRSYISRKEVAMTLVYQLVTQQNSETNTSIAEATLSDSTVMKVIAIVTMVFLPPTVVASFFGMAFFDISDGGQDVTSRRLWIFWAYAVPLTLAVLAISYLGWKWRDIQYWLEQLTGSKPRRTDIETGHEPHCLKSARPVSRSPRPRSARYQSPRNSESTLPV